MGKKRVFEADVSDQEDLAEVPDEIIEPKKSEKKPKQLPDGYICKICGMEEHHAAYDCPHKVKKFTKTPKESNNNNQVANDTEVADEVVATRHTVFISGLPFDLNRESLGKYLQDEGCEVGVIKKTIKLVMFEDNPKKCKGLAYVKFQNDEQVEKCLGLNGKKFGPLNLSVERVESSRPKTTKKSHPKAVMVHGANAKRCFRCGLHHDPSTCTNPRICYRCKSTDHLSSACPLKKQQS